MPGMFFLVRDPDTGEVWRVATDAQSKVLTTTEVLGIDQLMLSYNGGDPTVVEFGPVIRPWLDSIPTVVA